MSTCSLSWACEQVWLALVLGGVLGVGVMGLIFGPWVRRLEGERNRFRDLWRGASERANAAEARVREGERE